MGQAVEHGGHSVDPLEQLVVDASEAAGRCHLTFRVDGVTHETMTYDPGANVETSDKNY